MTQRNTQSESQDLMPRTGKRPQLDGDHRWSLRRFGENLLARRLEASMEGMVRHEKYATAQILSLRIARELEVPLRNLERHIAALELIAEPSPEIQLAVANLRADRHAILAAIRRLRQIEPPVGLPGCESVPRAPELPSPR